MIFYLGTHHPEWLARLDVPLFISRRSLVDRRTLPRARASWALDSGGFTELSLHGRWRLSAKLYADEVRRYRDEIGSLAWAAPQDWMCEEAMLAKTRLGIPEHQRRTLNNFLELRALAPDLPIIPVLQGWTEGDYLDHLDAYAAAGVFLDREPLVGLGSVCRRQNGLRASLIVAGLAREGLKIHAFGFKRTGLAFAWNDLASSDSMAWSLNARKSRPLDGCSHRSCANCERYALAWREETIAIGGAS